MESGNKIVYYIILLCFEDLQNALALFSILGHIDQILLLSYFAYDLAMHHDEIN
jgi:hypothetical protein